MQFLSALALLPIAALAAPTSGAKPAPAAPITGNTVVHSSNFTLTSKVNGGNFAYNGLKVYPYHIDPTSNWAVLENPATTTTKAPSAVINGTVNELSEARGNLFFGFGLDGSIPYGFDISSQYGNGSAVQINVGANTKGLYLHNEGIVAHSFLYTLQLDSAFFSGWYACNNTLQYGPALQLFAKFDQPTPSQCQEIDLVANHIDGSDAV